MHIVNTDYIRSWEEQRPAKIKELTSQGIVPVEWDLEQPCENDDEEDKKIQGVLSHWFAGKVSPLVNEIKPAKDIIDEIIKSAAESLQSGNGLLVSAPKL